MQAYGPLATSDGSRQFEVTHARAAKDHLVVTLKGVATREEAERLNGLELYVAREKLPAAEDDEYYHADLIGLAAENAAGEPIGRVVAIHNFGAGDIIEIAPTRGATMLLPFTNAVVPMVDLEGGRVVIELPGEIEGDDPVANSSIAGLRTRRSITKAMDTRVKPAYDRPNYRDGSNMTGARPS